MLSEYPLVKSFIVYKETPSYFPFVSLGISPPYLLTRSGKFVIKNKQSIIGKEAVTAVVDTT
jgi:hypothetical protein